MTKFNSSAALLTLLIATIGAGCNSDTASGGGGKMIASSAGATLTVYDDPYMGTPQAGMPNPIPKTVSGTATAFDMGGKMRLDVSFTGLPANRDFGSHLHKLACDNMKAGGHYQDKPWPMGDAGSSANDPVYANNKNEAWLDFKSDTSGKGTASAMVDWLPRAGEAKSIIIHTMTTASGGVAGSKLACLPITFQ